MALGIIRLIRIQTRAAFCLTLYLALDETGPLNPKPIELTVYSISTIFDSIVRTEFFDEKLVPQQLKFSIAKFKTDASLGRLF